MINVMQQVMQRQTADAKDRVHGVKTSEEGSRMINTVSISSFPEEMNLVMAIKHSAPCLMPRVKLMLLEDP